MHLLSSLGPLLPRPFALSRSFQQSTNRAHVKRTYASPKFCRSLPRTSGKPNDETRRNSWMCRRMQFQHRVASCSRSREYRDAVFRVNNVRYCVSSLREIRRMMYVRGAHIGSSSTSNAKISWCLIIFFSYLTLFISRSHNRDGSSKWIFCGSTQDLLSRLIKTDVFSSPNRRI